MKKIVALVLSLVMVLGLATTAFAAADLYDVYAADETMAAALKAGTATEEDLEITEVAAKTNKDGSGNVAYMALYDGVDTVFAVKTKTPTVSSFAVTEAGKTAVLYYVDIVVGAAEGSFAYDEVVKAYTDFGKKCGQYDVTPDAGEEFFVAKDGKLYLAGDADTAGGNYLLNGKVVSGTYEASVIEHVFTVAANKYDETLKDVVPTVARCTNAFCGMESKAIYLDGKAPAGSKVFDLDNTDYVVALGAADTSAPVAGDKVESAQTFDAGIAMYVGMSVMAAAGSAVVLKKKD